jgi:hypothetical protein
MWFILVGKELKLQEQLLPGVTQICIAVPLLTTSERTENPREVEMGIGKILEPLTIQQSWELAGTYSMMWVQSHSKCYHWLRWGKVHTWIWLDYKPETSHSDWAADGIIKQTGHATGKYKGAYHGIRSMGLQWCGKADVPYMERSNFQSYISIHAALFARMVRNFLGKDRLNTLYFVPLGCLSK